MLTRDVELRMGYALLSHHVCRLSLVRASD